MNKKIEKEIDSVLGKWTESDNWHFRYVLTTKRLIVIEVSPNGSKYSISYEILKIEPNSRAISDCEHVMDLLDHEKRTLHASKIHATKTIEYHHKLFGYPVPTASHFGEAV